MNESGKSDRRRFNTAERVALFLAANGRCANCGSELVPGWHADHINPWSAGGPTDATNGQALCPTCNLSKGSRLVNWTGPDLRDWQREALNTYLARNHADFLVVATPGAGKTTFALRLAHQLLDAGVVQRVVIVVPTEHLKVQWANSAHRCGISIDPTTKNADGLENHADYQGAALTYAQVASQPDLHRMGCGRRHTLVILDEIHHAGDERTWGDAVRHAFEPAGRRLALSGTPFRSDNNPIPFVTYANDPDGVSRSVADYSYGYGRAIRDGVCRQVDFHFYDGEMRWTDTGSNVTSSANLSAELASGDASVALETALDPDKGWMAGLLRVADKTLTAARQETPEAGGLVIAYRSSHARAYAKMLSEITGEQPTIVLSEDGPAANARIAEFAASRSRWLVAVRMVSEGVDVPRLAVGVYATKTKTEMFFRQAVGRFVRRQANEEQIATVFAPALTGLRIMAAEVEREIQHELDCEREEYEQSQTEAGGGSGTQQTLDLFARVPVAASAPMFDRVIHAGQEYSAEENERAEQLLLKHDFPSSALASLRKLVREELGNAVLLGEVTLPASTSPDALAPTYRTRKNLAAQVNRLARRIAVSQQIDHAVVQGKVNQHMGVSRRSDASIDQLQVGVAFLQRWLQESR